MNQMSPLTHFRRDDLYNEPHLQATGNPIPPREYLEAHPDVIELADRWVALRDKIAETDAEVRRLRREIAQAQEAHRLAKRAAIVNGTDPATVTNKQGAPEAELATIEATHRDYVSALQPMSRALAAALARVAPEIAAQAAINASAAIDKGEKAAKAANAAADEYVEAAAVVRSMTELEVRGGRVVPWETTRRGVTSFAITATDLAAAREYVESLRAEVAIVQAWRDEQVAAREINRRSFSVERSNV